MKKDRKPYITYPFAIILFLILLIPTYRVIAELQPPSVSTPAFAQSLWNQWGATILVLAFISLAGAASVLVLLGGGWRWQ
jgi:hypothetical protein